MPKRSLMEHCGYDSTLAVPAAITTKMQNYFVSQIKKYYDNPKLQPDGGNSGSDDKTQNQVVTDSKPTHQGNAYAKLDKFNVVSKGTARVAGWLVPDKPQGPISTYAYVLVMEHGQAKSSLISNQKGLHVQMSKKPIVNRAVMH